MRKETLNILYQKSTIVVASIYVLLIFVIVLLSENKLAIFFPALAIPIFIFVIDFIRRKRKIPIDEYAIPLAILIVFYFEYVPNFNQPFWLFYFLIIYRTILFVSNVWYKFILLLFVLFSVAVCGLHVHSDTNAILSKMVSLTVFATTTHLGFEYLLNYQEQLLQMLKIKNDVEVKLLKYKKELEEAQRIAMLGGWEVDLINSKISWSKEVYDIHEKPYDFEPTFDEAVGFYDDASKPIIIEAVTKSIKEGLPYDVYLSIYSASGAKKYIRTKGEAIFEGDKAIKLVGIFQDITKEHESEEKQKAYALDLEKKNSELDQFAYIVSHDLKAPLRGITNLSMWIEEDIQESLSQESKKNFLLLRKRVQRMENLINGILAYTRAGKSIAEEAYFSTYELIQDIITSLDIPNTYTVNIVQPLPFLKAERIKIEQVLLNLISNAIKYNTNSNPQLKISVSEQELFYLFAINDNGPGIAKAHQEKIFVIFQTLQSRDSFENTGVGLAIVKKIVEDAGGAVWVESEPEKGATFNFTWPK